MTTYTIKRDWGYAQPARRRTLVFKDRAETQLMINGEWETSGILSQSVSAAKWYNPLTWGKTKKVPPMGYLWMLGAEIVYEEKP